MTQTRRGFFKGALVTALASQALAAPLLGLAENSQEQRRSPRRLMAFDYAGVRLSDGLLKTQFNATRNCYLSIPDADILKGFRQQAGLPAPGEDMGGWCIHDTAGLFG